MTRRLIPILCLRQTASARQDLRVANQSMRSFACNKHSHLGGFNTAVVKREIVQKDPNQHGLETIENTNYSICSCHLETFRTVQTIGGSRSFFLWQTSDPVLCTSSDNGTHRALRTNFFALHRNYGQQKHVKKIQKVIKGANNYLAKRAERGVSIL